MGVPARSVVLGTIRVYTRYREEGIWGTGGEGARYRVKGIPESLSGKLGLCTTNIGSRVDSATVSA